MACEIGEDCSSFEDGEIVAVMVHDGGDSTIWRELGEPRLLLDVLQNVNTLVRIILAICSLQFLENDRSFVPIRGSPG
jgi:hypothetical protein